MMLWILGVTFLMAAAFGLGLLREYLRSVNDRRLISQMDREAACRRQREIAELEELFLR